MGASSSTTPSTMAASSSTNTILVAAIDFGTAYSGYAFSFRDKPLDVQTPQTWYAGSTQLASLKTPSCILIQTGQKTLFGFEAENTYAEQTANDADYVKKSYFFQHFKMLLHGNRKLSKSTRVDDINGKSMKALKVFSLSIEYFKNHLIETLQGQTTGVDLKDIHFVITVPAIWNDSAKQFMREASVKAGLDNDQLTIALEPEAASIYCQQLPTDKFQSSCKFDVAKAGTEYMVVGGTVDITVHRKEVDMSLSSLHAATGGPWGGQMVNKEYINFLTKIVGNEIMQNFSLEEKADYYELLREFEYKKRTVMSGKKNYIIRIPVSQKEMYEKVENKKFEEALERSKFSHQISFSHDKMKVDHNFMAQMFKASIDATLNHVSEILDEPKMRNVDRILLVGGYSESPLVHKAFRDRFGEKRIIIPNEAGLAVLKGAVQFGHYPAVISSRILSYTYGIASDPKFEEGIHREEHKYIDDEGVCRCRDVFSVIKHLGDSVKLGAKVSETRIPISKSSTELSVKVFSSSGPNPKYTTDKGCNLLDEIIIKLQPYTGKNRYIKVNCEFGFTELMVEVKNKATGEMRRKYFELP